MVTEGPTKQGTRSPIELLWTAKNNYDDEYDEGNVVSSNDESDDHLELGPSTDWCSNNFLTGLSHQGKLN